MSCSGNACGKPKSFVDLSWSNKDKYELIPPYYQNDVGVDSRWCNNDPTVYICGYTNTDNVGYIPMHGACSKPNKSGFYKKQFEDSRRPSEFQGKPPGHLRISQTYLGDISPMFGAKTAYENVYGPIIKPVPVDTSTVLVYPDGQPYPPHQYI
jgi:hypothetical protein